jgi:exopolyphosphatase/guanosine-5'-triphosphate,3'-diphosphate pyrophosphatase
MNINVLDMGSTSFHAQAFEVDDNGAFRTRFSDRRALHLGGEVYRTGRIGEASWERAVATVGELLNATCAGRKDITIAVATSVLRDAANGLAFRVELWNRYRLGVQLLTPEHEARFTYLGATTTPQVGGRRVAVIDLGGGSLEVAVGEGTRCLLAGSVPLGVMSLRQRVDRASRSGASDLGRVHELVEELGRDLFAQARALSPEVVVFASGTARRSREQLQLSTGAPGRVGEIECDALRHAVSEATRVEARFTDGDGDPLLAGAIMLASMELLRTERAVVSSKGLRDGVALDVYRQAARRSVLDPVRVWNQRLASLPTVPSNLARRD